MIVPSIMAYSMSGSSETAPNIRLKTSALTQWRNRLKTVFQRPNCAGRSRQGAPVRAIHKTASRNNRASAPVRPGSVFFPRQYGSIRIHWASVRLRRSIANSFAELESEIVTHGNPESQQALERGGLFGQTCFQNAVLARRRINDLRGCWDKLSFVLTHFVGGEKSLSVIKKFVPKASHALAVLTNFS